jgi:hypothetical protein
MSLSTAKQESHLSIIELIVVHSAAISPAASISTFFVKSPPATAVYELIPQNQLFTQGQETEIHELTVATAILRTWSVICLLIVFTLSVRVFQTPWTSRTTAWPPNSPSVPTSLATLDIVRGP